MPRPVLQYTAALAAGLLYPLRRRYPEPVMLLMVAAAGMLPLLGPAAAAATYTVAPLLRPGCRRAGVWALASVLPVTTAMAATAIGGTGPSSLPYAVILGLVLMVAAVVLPGLVGTLVGQENRLVQALRERAEEAERARALAESEARTQERSRIAAEMHDFVGHRLSLASLHAGGLELALARTAPELRPHAVAVRTTLGDALRELRQALGVLDPLGVNTRAEAALTEDVGTRADIGDLVAQSAAVGVDVALEWAGPDLTDTPVPVRRALHRVVREALTNVHQYAIGAKVTVVVTRAADSVQVSVHNTVPPRPVAPGSTSSGRGLPALRERVEVLEGRFTAGPLPAGGFRLAASLPLYGAGPAISPAVKAPPMSAGPAKAPAPVGRRAPQAIRAFILGTGLAALTALILAGIGAAYAEPSRTSPHQAERWTRTPSTAFAGHHGVDGKDHRLSAAAALAPLTAAMVHDGTRRESS
ncbi:sensor histidine kinase [Streptomyces sp. NPDC056670]|uniref:sensor histidine kinase n=1 Tax=Streptomyces sp. NPDC056670 TaxID=3345904 RepID=UPI003676A29A